jgi:hypothetical protein
MRVSRMTPSALAGAVVQALATSARADSDVVALGAFITQSDAMRCGIATSSMCHARVAVLRHENRRPS